MRDNSKWIRRKLCNLIRVRDSYEDRRNMYRMDRNERTWEISDNIIDEIRHRIDSDILTNYTEVEGTYHKIADYLGVKSEQLYLHSGSDLVIKSIFDTYIEPGDKVLIQNPSYAMYSVYSQMFDARVYECDFNENLTFDIDRYCELVKKFSPKMAVLENPGGYIGNSFQHEEVEQFVDTASKCGTLAIVDEAYIDYIPDAQVIDLIARYDNLIIVRTFSKAWGLAGLRAGYAISNETIIAELFKVRPMHELTSFTAMVVETLLDQLDEMKAYVEDVIKVRNYFCKKLDELGIRYAESDTHFVTVCIGDLFDADDFREKAHDSRFYVRRPFEQERLKNWVRIGLLPMRDMERFVKFLEDYKGNQQQE